MAIAFDSSAKGTITTGTSLTFAHTCTGSNLILIAYFYGSGSGDTCSATYNGTSMTQFKTIVDSSNNKQFGFYLINPATGANNVVATFGNSGQHGGVSGSYTGVKQSGQPDSSGSADNSGVGTTVTVSTTVVASNCWVVSGGFANGLSGITCTSNKTDRQYQSMSSTFVGLRLSDTNSTVATGSQSIIFTINQSGQVISGISASIAPYVAPTVNTGAFLAFM